ncbi:cytochrome c3 family protein [Bacteroidota bacterium]
MKGTLLIILFLNFISLQVFSQSITNTVHNLSVSGSGDIHADEESEICIFCHIPHNSTSSAPLWNRNRDDLVITYTLYNSSTIQANPDQPDGSSILCLSCHDGTIALGNVVSRTSDISFVSSITTMPDERISNLKTDLSDDHPISFVFNSTLASSDEQLNYPPTFPVSVDINDKVQCTSCHDPHKDDNTKFLVASNEYSVICISCHDRTSWSGSSHESSTAGWNDIGDDPWGHIDVPYSTVTQNACENCHNSHSASGEERLLKSDIEENNCLDCHNSNVALTNIETQMDKDNKHNAYGYTGIHDATENALISDFHIECVDCHNPHAVNNATASAPDVNGFITGVQGINQDGNEVSSISYEYELCYRCHADNPVKPPATVRMVVQGNVRLEFDNTSASFHPVAYVGKNSSVPSLYNGWTVASRTYCTDCHASDGTAPSGPHGSNYPQILRAYYNRSPYTNIGEGDFPVEYELCAICHDVDNLSGVHGSKQSHILKFTSCNSCHDPHGSDLPYLLNYDPSVMSGNTAGDNFFDTGNNDCNLKCHLPGKGDTIAHVKKYAQ